MTSPVDTSVKVFTSDMANAPALTQGNGALVALLDAVLKDGFDTKAVTSLTVSGGVATLVWSGVHAAMANAVILLAGVTGGPTGFAGMNGEQKVQTKPNSTSCTFTTTLPDGTYTGTITSKIAPLGWEKPFSGTNKGAYRSADLASTRMFLRVDDNYSSGGCARVVGMETMTDIDTGTGPFPSPSQGANLPEGGGWWGKADAATQAAGWVIVGDGRTFFMHVSPYLSNGPTYSAYLLGKVSMFGDLIASRTGGDAYACVLSTQPAPGPSSYPTQGNMADPSNASNFLPRDWTGVGSSIAAYCIPYTGSYNNQSGMDTTLGSFPSVIDGSMRLSRKFFATVQGTTPPRGDIPGVLSIPQSNCGGLAHKAIYPGTGGLAGRKLMGFLTSNSGFSTVPTVANSGNLLIDVTGPWR